MKAHIIKTPWGLAFSLKEAEQELPNKRDEAFISAPSEKLRVGKQYSFTLSFHVNYKRNKEGEETELEKQVRAEYKTNSYQEAINHPDFIKYKLNPNSIVPYATNIQEV